MAKTKKSTSVPEGWITLTGPADDLSEVPTVMLANMGCLRVELIEQYQKELVQIREAIDSRFPGQKNEEELGPYSFGVVKRTVRNRWDVVAERIDQIREKLGKTFADYVKESRVGVLAQDRLDELRDQLGRDYDYYVTDKIGYSWLPKFKADVEKDAAFKKAMAKNVQITPSVTITFKPVQEDN